MCLTFGSPTKNIWLIISNAAWQKQLDGIVVYWEWNITQHKPTGESGGRHQNMFFSNGFLYHYCDSLTNSPLSWYFFTSNKCTASFSSAREFCLSCFLSMKYCGSASFTYSCAIVAGIGCFLWLLHDKMSEVGTSKEAKQWVFLFLFWLLVSKERNSKVSVIEWLSKMM